MVLLGVVLLGVQFPVLPTGVQLPCLGGVLLPRTGLADSGDGEVLRFGMLVLIEDPCPAASPKPRETLLLKGIAVATGSRISFWVGATDATIAASAATLE